MSKVKMESKVFKNIAELLKYKRVKAGLSQKNLGVKVGYRKEDAGQCVSNIEREVCSIPIKKIPEFQKELGISENEMKEALKRDLEETLNPFLLKDEKNKTLLKERKFTRGPRWEV